MPWDEQAELFRRKASDDETAMRGLAPDPLQPDSVIGFHAQQAVEKLLKAVLAHHQIVVRRTHDLTELIDLLKAHGHGVPPEIEEARRLQPYAVSFRYEDIPEEAACPLDRTWAIECVQQTRAWVDHELGDERGAP